MTYEESDNKYGSDAGPTVGPSLARVPSSDDKRPPSEGPSRPPLLSIMAALAGLLHMITSTSARAARGRANVSYLPPPPWSSAAARPSAPAGNALSHDTASARANESRGPGKTARSRRVCATERVCSMSRSRLGALISAARARKRAPLGRSWQLRAQDRVDDREATHVERRCRRGGSGRHWTLPRLAWSNQKQCTDTRRWSKVLAIACYPFSQALELEIHDSNEFTFSNHHQTAVSSFWVSISGVQNFVIRSSSVCFVWQNRSRMFPIPIF